MPIFGFHVWRKSFGARKKGLAARGSCSQARKIASHKEISNLNPSLRELKFSVATCSRQFDQKRKPALLGKHSYSSVAIRYKVAGYVEEMDVKIYLRL